jgi:hypothetical protein
MNKQKAEGQEMCRMIRREMGRHTVDCSEVQVSCTHGSVHLHGRVRPMRGHEGAFESSVNGLLKALRQRPGIRDVHAEWTCVF